MLLSPELLRTIVDETKRNGGHTYPTPPPIGYMVANLDCNFCCDVEQFDESYLREYIKYTGWHQGYLGTWVEDGKVYLDISECKKDKLEAILLGFARRQLAIWDNENSTCIKLQDYVAKGH